jgi:membrane protease YdiL (CAAX protease family)
MVLPLMGQKPTPFEFPNTLFWVFPLAACLLGLGIWKKRIVLPRLAPSEGVWFLAGASIGLLWFALEGIVYIHWLNFPVPAYQGPLMLLAPVYQMGYAAVPEEMVFRAFLWGGLRKIGVPAFWVLMIQSVLFTAAHIHLLRTPAPAVYLGSVFLTAVILGLLVWRSRRISTGMACHAFGNGSQLFQYWINTLVFR